MKKLHRTPTIPLFALLFTALVLPGCSGSDHDGAVGTDRMEEGRIPLDGERTEQERNAGAMRTDGRTERPDTTRTNVEMKTTDDRATAGPAAGFERDRRSVEEGLQKLRSELDEELAAVRGRLRIGTRTPEERQADQSRAAQLGQALTRLDNSISRVGSATAATWSEVREDVTRERNELMAVRDAGKDRKS
jgi:hypothetical protein